MARSKVKIPSKPYPDFPLFPAKNGQWRKDIWNPRLRRAEQFYFGSWEEDPKGERALAEYVVAKVAIANGTYHAKIATHEGGNTIRQLAKEYLAARYQDMHTGKLTGSAYNPILLEVQRFGKWVDANIGESVTIEGMKVEFFAAYVQHLLTVRKLGPYAEKRVKSLLKTMFKWAADNGRAAMPAFGTAWKAPNTTKAAMKKYRMRAGIRDTSDNLWSGAQIDTLVAIAPKNMKAMILLAVNCGLGPADLGRVRWRHVNLETGELNMPRGKTGQDRHGYIWKKTQKLMLMTRKLKHNRIAFEKEGQDALVFLTRLGLPFFREEEKVVNQEVVGIRTQDSFGTTFRRLCKRTGIKGLRLYQLRHTFATLARFVGKGEVVTGRESESTPRRTRSIPSAVATNTGVTFGCAATGS